MRAVAGIVVGLIASLVAAVIAGMVAFGATVSLPPGTDAADTRQVVAILTTMPQATQLALPAAWFASALCGAVAARLIARRAWAAWAVALVVTAYFSLNALVLPLPLWAKAAWIIAPLIGGLIGNYLVSGRAAPAALAAEVEAPPANP